MFSITRYLRYRREYHIINKLVNDYLYSHYFVWDVITGRWSKIKLQNPYCKNVKVRRKGGYRRPHSITFR